MIAVAAIMAVVVTAQPVLPLKTAQKRALREAQRIARVFPKANRPKVRVGSRDCQRRSRSTVDCTGTFTFTGQVCTRKIRVRYASSRGMRLRVSLPGEPVCRH